MLTTENQSILIKLKKKNSNGNKQHDTKAHVWQRINKKNNINIEINEKEKNQ